MPRSKTVVSWNRQQMGSPATGSPALPPDVGAYDAAGRRKEQR